MNRTVRMGENCVHAILTRFNLATPGQESTLRNRMGWLERRFDLFEQYCLPSMAAQTERNFRWIVLFDENTPQAFRDRIDADRRICDFIPHFTGLFPAEGWLQAVREHVIEPSEWLLTTRLDNDDALSLDHVMRLHTAVSGRPPRRGAFNFTRGYILDGGRLYALEHPRNAFFSWLEPFDPDARTASSIAHMKIDQHGPVVQIPGPGAWLQVIHGENVSNKVRGRRVPPEDAASRFPPEILKRMAPAAPAAVIAENVLLTPLRAFRDRILGLQRA